MQTPEKLNARQAAGSLHGEVIMGKPFVLRLLRVTFECTATAFLTAKAFDTLARYYYTDSCAWFPTAHFFSKAAVCEQSEFQAAGLLSFLCICFVVSLTSTTFAAGQRFQQSALFAAGMLALTSIDAYLHGISLLQIALSNALLFVFVFLGYRAFFWLRDTRKTQTSK